jgi:hypothetical protein
VPSTPADPTSLPLPRTPFAATASVLEGRDEYLAENGFTTDAYEAEWVVVSIFGVSFRTPSPERRRRAIKFHDLHHVATGFGTDLAGEAEISAWELRRGISGLGLFIGSIVLSVALLGLFIAPRRTLRAWHASRTNRPLGSRRSLFQTERDYESLLRMTVGELRRELVVPEGGIASGSRGLHARAPKMPPGSSSPAL